MRRFFIVLGRSMNPLFGLVTIIWCRKFDDLRVGDIVVFRRNDDIVKVVHRIIDFYYVSGVCYFVIKGDNSDSLDLVKADRISYVVDEFCKLL